MKMGYYEVNFSGSAATWIGGLSLMLGTKPCTILPWMKVHGPQDPPKRSLLLLQQIAAGPDPSKAEATGHPD